MPPQLVLSLFPGIDILGMGFEECGFTIVRGPDVLWGGDIRTFSVPAGRFDGVLGGPPCQAFSRLSYMVRQNGYEPKFGNLIPEFERVCFEAQPQWFLMENVREAPIPAVAGYEVFSCLLNNRQLGEAQNRVRRWSFGTRDGAVLMIDTVALESIEFEYAAVGGSQERFPIKLNSDGTKKSTLRAHQSRLPFNSKSASAFRELCRKQGLPEDFDLPGFTVAGKCKAVGNAVPMAMARALAKAVREYVESMAINTGIGA